MMRMPRVLTDSEVQNTECFVRGPLALTLYISRFLGLAPLRFKRARNGWRISYSRPFAIYSYVFMVLVHAGKVYGLYQVYSSTKESLQLSSTASTLSWIAMHVIYATISTIGVIYGPKRMMLMIDYVYKMDNIHKKFCRILERRPKEKKRTAAVGFIIFVLFSFHANVFREKIIEVISAGSNWQVLILFLSNSMQNMMLYLTVTQFTVVGYMIGSSMKYINRSLENLIHVEDLQIKPRPYSLIEGVLGVTLPLPKFNGIITVAERRAEIQNEDVTQDSSSLPSISSHGLAYAVICSVQLQVNESFSTVLILLVNAIFIKLMITVYSYVFLISSTAEPHHLIALSGCVIQTLTLLMVTEPTESIKVQLQRLRFLFSHMLCRVDPEDPRCTELHFFYEQLTLDNPVFVISGVCKLRRSILFLMIGGIFTYITFLWQFNIAV